MRDVFTPYVPRVLSSADLSLPEPTETGNTFFKNALIKAQAAMQASGHPALADDSGLCIAALNDDPGVHTADWLGYPRNDRMGMQRVLHLMGDTDNRTAYFTTTLVLVWPDGHIETATGRVDGTITHAITGTGGHGYDPIFRPDGHARTFAEMSLSEKQGLSHRGQAVDQMIAQCFRRP
jgi:XTP/dITP diphosphohydrolase